MISRVHVIDHAPGVCRARCPSGRGADAAAAISRAVRRGAADELARTDGRSLDVGFRRLGRAAEGGRQPARERGRPYRWCPDRFPAARRRSTTRTPGRASVSRPAGRRSPGTSRTTKTTPGTTAMPGMPTLRGAWISRRGRTSTCPPRSERPPISAWAACWVPVGRWRIDRLGEHPVRQLARAPAEHATRSSRAQLTHDFSATLECQRVLRVRGLTIAFRRRRVPRARDADHRRPLHAPAHAEPRLPPRLRIRQHRDLRRRRTGSRHSPNRLRDRLRPVALFDAVDAVRLQRRHGSDHERRIRPTSTTGFSTAHITGVGHVTLTQEMGRSWQLNAYYNRQVSYEPGVHPAGSVRHGRGYPAGPAVASRGRFDVGPLPGGPHRPRVPELHAAGTPSRRFVRPSRTTSPRTRPTTTSDRTWPPTSRCRPVIPVSLIAMASVQGSPRGFPSGTGEVLHDPWQEVHS